MATTFLDKVKQRLRITHNKLDDDLSAEISAARDELQRIGVDAAMAASEDDPLITEAVKTYVQYKNAPDPKEADNLWASWITQADGIRKARTYRRSD